MKKLIILLVALTGVAAAWAAGSYSLTCTNEHSNAREVVEVSGASTFSAACNTIKNDPAYGHYNACVDAAATNNQGSCP